MYAYIIPTCTCAYVVWYLHYNIIHIHDIVSIKDF